MSYKGSYTVKNIRPSRLSLSLVFWVFLSLPLSMFPSLFIYFPISILLQKKPTHIPIETQLLSSPIMSILSPPHPHHILSLSPWFYSKGDIFFFSHLGSFSLFMLTQSYLWSLRLSLVFVNCFAFSTILNYQNHPNFLNSYNSLGNKHVITT